MTETSAKIGSLNLPSQTLNLPPNSAVGNIADLSFDIITPAGVRRDAYVYGQPLKPRASLSEEIWILLRTVTVGPAQPDE